MTAEQAGIKPKKVDPFPGTSNTMMALAVLFSIVAIFVMVKYTSKRGFWWGLGFWVLGGTAGAAIGRLIEPPQPIGGPMTDPLAAKPYDPSKFGYNPNDPIKNIEIKF